VCSFNAIILEFTVIKSVYSHAGVQSLRKKWWNARIIWTEARGTESHVSLLIRCRLMEYTREGGRKQNKQNEKALRETQTLRAGRSNA